MQKGADSSKLYETWNSNHQELGVKRLRQNYYHVLPFGAHCKDTIAVNLMVGLIPGMFHNVKTNIEGKYI